ncbi:lantibiotic dehydratase [Polymorphospora rubra]|uniref:lantibiotic dehydratase n=1 Tax=Polymorphospora rubra TaxID=338584 RepID=UPI0033CEA490
MARTMQFRHTDFVLLRATTLGDGSDLPGDLDIGGAIARGKLADVGTAWLTQVWGRATFQAAVALASPALADQVDAVVAGARVDERRLRRLIVSVAMYVARWRGRPTPFGLFAGVAGVAVGVPAVRWGDRHHALVRPDEQWWIGIVDALERRLDVLERLPVVVNPAATVRGDWLVVPGQPPIGASAALAPLEVSARRTRPVRAAVDAAQEPISFRDLAKWMGAQFPTASSAQIRELLAGLVAQHMLITSLRAPMTVPDTLGHLIGQLEAVGVDEISDVRALLDQLRTIHWTMNGHHEPGTDRGRLDAIGRQMRAIGGANAQPVRVDLRLDAEVSVPESVISEAESAASTLLRLTPYPYGYPAWREWHLSFRRRYGPGAVVAVQEAVADSGLGLPAGYLGSGLGLAPATLSDRDSALLTLAQQATLDGADEIVLDSATIDSLTVGDPAEMIAPPWAEIAFELQARSLDDLRQGAYRLVVAGTPRTGSSMLGRFADVLTESERARLIDVVAGTGEAQLVFGPRRRRSANVVRTPQLLPQTISVAEQPGGTDAIPLDDLGIAADARRLRLVRLSTGAEVVPRVLHALEAGALTPPLARFLAEVSTARCAVYRGWDWGAAERLPYVPRVRYGRVVLAPARWRLHANDLPGRTATLQEWETSLDNWRHRYRVPAAVVLCESDLRLPLHLDRCLDRSVLRSRLSRVERVDLREGASDADRGWIGRAHELLVPLRAASREPAVPTLHDGGPPAVEQAAAVHPPVARDVGHLPGRSRWLAARIHGHPGRQSEILTEHLPRLDFCDSTVWWYRRHRDTTRPDTRQYLELFIRLPSPEQYGPAAAQVGEWAAELRDAGLVPGVEFVPYQPETGRYGQGEAMTAAEEAFAADSAAAIEQLTFAAAAGMPIEAVAAASMVNLAESYAANPHDGWNWLIGHLPREQGRVDRDLRATALRLTDSANDRTLRLSPGGPAVLDTWQRRRTALTAYHRALTRQRDPMPALYSLLHLHHIRTVGVDPTTEKRTNRLVRAIALRQILHTEGTR